MSVSALAAASLCLSLAGGTPVGVEADRFTLSWTHSVEKIEWREAWRVADGRLELEQAWVRGSGAGMEIPDGAVREGDAWAYAPDLPPLERLSLAASDYTAAHILCAGGVCRELDEWLHRPAGDDRPVEISACPQLKNR